MLDDEIGHPPARVVQRARNIADALCLDAIEATLQAHVSVASTCEQTHEQENSALFGPKLIRLSKAARAKARIHSKWDLHRRARAGRRFWTQTEELSPTYRCVVICPDDIVWREQRPTEVHFSPDLVIVCACYVSSQCGPRGANGEHTVYQANREYSDPSARKC